MQSVYSPPVFAQIHFYALPTGSGYQRVLPKEVDVNSLICKASVMTFCVGALALVSACGESGVSERQSAPTVDACALLTAADAGEILGGPAAQPETYMKLDRVDERGGNALSNCLYERLGGNETVSVLVSYRSINYPASFAALREEVDGTSDEMKEMALELLDAAEPVDGLGEFAYWTAELGTLTIYADGHYQLTVTADGAASGDSSGARARAVDAAGRMLARL